MPIDAPSVRGLPRHVDITCRGLHDLAATLAALAQCRAAAAAEASSSCAKIQRLFWWFLWAQNSRRLNEKNMKTHRKVM